jgi:hypothetical protein
MAVHFLHKYHITKLGFRCVSPKLGFMTCMEDSDHMQQSFCK